MLPWDPAFYRKSPLFWPISSKASLFERHLGFPPVEALDEALSADARVRFRRQPPRPRRQRRRRGGGARIDPASLYDARITQEGWVPTRPSSWHDFLNALVWATFPKSKAALHARQHRLMTARLMPDATSLPSERTREQDGLALLDEGSLLLVTDAGFFSRDASSIHAALASGAAAALIFGHALYESLLPLERRSIWAMVALLPCPASLPQEKSANVLLADELLAAIITETDSFCAPETFFSVPLDERLHPFER